MKRDRLLRAIATIYDAALDPSKSIEAQSEISCFVLDDAEFGTKNHQSGSLSAPAPSDTPYRIAAETSSGRSTQSDALSRDPARDDGDADAVAAFRNVRLGVSQQARLELLIPHLTRAAEIRRRITSAQDMLGLGFDALDQAGAALLLMDSSGCIMFANIVAREIVAGSGVLRLVGRGSNSERLVATSPRINAALCDALTQCASERPARGACTVYARRAATSQATILRFQRLPVVLDSMARSTPVVMVTMVDTSRSTELEPLLLQQTFGLSRRECEIVSALANGADVSEVARQSCIAEATVRSHLKRIFKKLKVSSQAELIRKTSSLQAGCR